jgi:Zn-dependent peptidase ImmA (M78 family)
MYKLTHLEDWIAHLYSILNILTPKDICHQEICRPLHIYLAYKEVPSCSVEFGRFKCITLDNRKLIRDQREDFFHELCHLLRHNGDQTMMPKAFRELQESQAETFTSYAALPYSMLKEYDLYDQDIIQTLSDDFKVTEALVIKRLSQVKDRLLTYRNFTLKEV